MPYGADPITPPSGYGRDPTTPPSPEKIFYNEVGQPFTLSGKPVPLSPPAPDQGYTGSILPLRRDEQGLHLAVPEAIASPVRGMVSGGKRAVGADESGKSPLRPLSPDELSAAMAFSPASAAISRPLAGTEGAAGKFIQEQFTRAVKPSVRGKQTAGQLERYQSQARDAVSSIVENRPNLTFKDAAGNVRQGELPKTLEEFGDAIEQTKQTIFNKYDAMARQTQAGGIEVSLVPAANELETVAGDQVTQLMHPELAKYAQDRADAFRTAGQLPAVDAQRAITSLNSTLKTFYSNISSPEVAARAHVDAMIANKLRERLDQAVEDEVGPGYQDLKNQYGSLKAIEKDVNHRAQIVARQETGGGLMGRIADVASAEEVIRGLLTFNPVAVARGVGLKGWAQYVKFRRSPNRAVTSLFQAAEGPPIPRSPFLPSQSETAYRLAPGEMSRGDQSPSMAPADPYGMMPR